MSSAIEHDHKQIIVHVPAQSQKLTRVVDFKGRARCALNGNYVVTKYLYESFPQPRNLFSNLLCKRLFRSFLLLLRLH